MKIAAIIVAAGQGQRAGGAVPKQRQILAGKPVYQWSVDAFLNHPQVANCILVVPPGDEGSYADQIERGVQIVPGGTNRTKSVKAGLNACSLETSDIVLIHDAARPGLPGRLISDLIATMAHADAAAPALPIVDALKRQSDTGLSDLNRDGLYRVQTPQMFKYGAIAAALQNADALVDDLAAIEAMNGSITLIPGSETLAKITYPEDFKRLENLLMPAQSIPRLGTGFDVHAFEPGDGVTLCGVTIPFSKKLAGHSDADVAWHALTDAILGAAALGDIGDHFPPSDRRWKDADSALFLKHAVEIAAEAGWAVSSCDITIICEAPKIKPHREAMRLGTSDLLCLPLEAVSVKATTTEGLGFTGRGEGIAAQASAVLSPLPSHK